MDLPANQYPGQGHISAYSTIRELIASGAPADLTKAEEIFSAMTDKYLYVTGNHPTEGWAFGDYVPVSQENWVCYCATTMMTSMWAAAAMELYKATGNEEYKLDALSAAKYLTYDTQWYEGGMETWVRSLSLGYPMLGRTWYEQPIYTVINYLQMMAANPEMAPNDENHILLYTSVLKDIAYTNDQIDYTATGVGGGEELLKLKDAIAGIYADGELLPRVLDIEAAVEGWLWDDANQLLYVKHDGADPVSVILLADNIVAGDADADGDVDGTDLATLGLSWDPGGTSRAWLQGDFDGDGDVDGSDLAALGLAWAPGGYSYETEWQTGTDDWFVALNWTQGPPTINDTAYVLNGGEAQLSSGSATAKTVYLGQDSGESGTISQSGGTLTVFQDIHVGYDAGSSGTYNLSGGDLIVNGQVRVGAGLGTGRFEWFGGTIDTPQMTLGTQGTLAMGFSFNVASLASGSMFVGGGSLAGLGTSTLEVTGGATATHDSGIVAIGTLRVGSSSGGGTYNFSSGTMTGGVVRIGDGGTGLLAQTGGGSTINDLSVGSASGSSGTYQLGSGATLVVIEEAIGDEGTGTFT